MPRLGYIALHEVVQVLPLERIGLEREVHVGAQVVNPELAGPRGLTGRLLVEEQHVSLHALGIEQSGGQAQQSVDVAFVQ